jgi:hypothetical protein
MATKVSWPGNAKWTKSPTARTRTAVGSAATRKKRAPVAGRISEAQIQRQVAMHLDRRIARGAIWWHTPNGGERNAIEAKMFQAQGVKSGIPDILIFWNGKLYGLELKAADGVVSQTQKAMLAAFSHAGAVTGVAYGADEALGWLEQHGILRSHFDVATERMSSVADDANMEPEDVDDGFDVGAGSAAGPR